MNKKKLEKAAKALMSMEPVKLQRPKKRPKKPTKKDLHRKFRMKLSRKGKPIMEEVQESE